VTSVSYFEELSAFSSTVDGSARSITRTNTELFLYGSCVIKNIGVVPVIVMRKKIRRGRNFLLMLRVVIDLDKVHGVI